MADVLAVPADHPTIEAAIEAAQDGDEILVAPGVWYENLFVRKQVTITGSGQGVTIIDGSQPAMFSFGSCVVVSGGFSKSNEPVRLQSLTLRNGFGAEIYGVVRGGGIYSEFAKVELNQVTIEDCNVLPQNESDSMGWGGAICNYGGAYVINDSTLRNNRSFSHGGAIFVYGSLVLNNTLITNNIADLAGGAIYRELARHGARVPRQLDLRQSVAVRRRPRSGTDRASSSRALPPERQRRTRRGGTPHG